jgi:hypothetical protein
MDVEPLAERSRDMSNSTVNELVSTYFAIWNEVDPAARQRLIADAWTNDAAYVDPMFAAEGHAGIEAMVAGFRQQFPLLTFRQIGETEAHHDRIRFSWELVPAGGGDVIAAGTDVAVIENDRLRAVTGFFDQAPVLEAV